MARAHWGAVSLACLLAACGGGSSAGGGSGAGGSSVAGGGSGAGGGSSVAGGGSSSVGGGTITTGGGSSSAGGGSASGSGAVTLVEVGVVDPSIGSDSAGLVHLVYGVEASKVAYRQCAGNCGVSSSWPGIYLYNGPSLTGRSRLVVGADKRVHVLYEPGDQTFYATCGGNCLQAANWQHVELTSLLGQARSSWKGDPFVIDASGRLSFINSTLTTNADIVLGTCASGCTTLANWSAGIIRQGGIRMGMAAQGTTLHLFLNNDLGAIVYRTCAGNCTVAASWTESPPLFANGVGSAIRVAVTPGGALRVAYNQGVANDGESQQVKAQDRKNLVWGCDSNCLQQASWQGVILGDLKDGEDSLDFALSGNAMGLLTSTDDLKVVLRVCETNCFDAASWQSVLVDSTTACGEAFDPYMALMCGTARPVFAAWYPTGSRMTARPTGGVVAVHGAYGLRQCAGSMTSRQPAIGRIITLE